MTSTVHLNCGSSVNVALSLLRVTVKGSVCSTTSVSLTRAFMMSRIGAPPVPSSLLRGKGMYLAFLSLSHLDLRNQDCVGGTPVPKSNYKGLLRPRIRH